LDYGTGERVYRDPVTHYETLGVSPSATTAEIRRAYRRLVARWHPDRTGAAERGEATRRMQAITAAWGTLKDAQRRARYDATLRTTRDVPRNATHAPPGRTPGGAAREEQGRRRRRRPTERPPEPRSLAEEQALGARIASLWWPAARAAQARGDAVEVRRLFATYVAPFRTMARDHGPVRELWSEAHRFTRECERVAMRERAVLPPDEPAVPPAPRSGGGARLQRGWELLRTALALLRRGPGGGGR